VYFTLSGGQTIVGLLLMGYSFVTQLFPAVVLSLGATRWVTREGVAAGIVAGVATVAAVSVTHTTVGTLFPALPVQIKELNVGLIALAVNVVVLVVVSFAANWWARGRSACAARFDGRTTFRVANRRIDKAARNRRTCPVK
jgi:solute:Na+ symporter, SSS family